MPDQPYAFENGGDALAHLRQLGSMPLGAWFQRLLQNPAQAAAAQQGAAMGNAQQMTAQAPAMAASDPYTAQAQAGQDQESKMAALASLYDRSRAPAEAPGEPQMFGAEDMFPQYSATPANQRPPTAPAQGAPAPSATSASGM